MIAEKHDRSRSKTIHWILQIELFFATICNHVFMDLIQFLIAQLDLAIPQFIEHDMKCSFSKIYTKRIF